MIPTMYKRSAGHFCHQSSDKKTSGDKIIKCVHADVGDRLDILAIDPEITCLPHVTDSYLSFLELPRVTKKRWEEADLQHGHVLCLLCCVPSSFLLQSEISEG